MPLQQFDGQIRGGTFDVANLNAALLKSRYLVGIQINGVDDGFFDYWIENAINYVKDETGLSIRDEVINDEPHDYYASDFLQYSFLKLNRVPIKSVLRIDAIYPTGNYLFTFPNDWLRVDRNGGQVQIVPSGGSLAQALLGQGGTYLPIIYRNLQYLPQLFHVYYTAGWEPGKVPNQLADAVCKKACIDVLAIIGDVIYGPGVVSRSVSVDGLSQSESFINNGQMGAIFTSRIVQYAKDLWGDPTNKTGGDQDGLIWSLKKMHRGLDLTVLSGQG
jgi:hypothetical protein